MLGLDNPVATGTTAVAIPFLIQALKNSTWFPWISRETERLNFALAITVAGLSAVGIHFAWDPHGFTITVDTHTLWSWFIQWVAQQAAYKGLVVPSETLGEIRGLLRVLAQQTPQVKGKE